MSKKMKNTDYLCLSAMLRAREAKMLTREKMEHMLSESAFADAARVLVDCGYEDMSAMDSKQINQALERHRAAEIADLYELAPDKAVVDVFRLKYEYHNAKVIVKAGGAKVSGDELISGSGRNDVAELVNAYDTGESDDLPKILTEAINEAKVLLAKSGNPQLADFVLDKAYFCELSEIAKQSASKFLKGYVQILIDSANLRAAVRTISTGGKPEKLAGALIPGGSVDSAAIIAGMDSRDSINQLYANTVFAKAVEAGNMTAFELEADNAVNEYLADAERTAFGPEVVVEYLAAVENEIMAIRIILTGKLTGIDPKLLRERLRESYV